MNTYKYYNRIAIMGAGGMGTLLGASLNKCGLPVDLIDVNKKHIDALNENGATVKGKLNFNVPVHAYTSDSIEGQYDLIFYMVKQTYNESALKQLEGHLKDDGIICTVQNGMPEMTVAAVFGKERTVGCCATFTARLGEPGVTFSTCEKINWHCTLGWIDGHIDDKLLEIKEILELCCPTEITENLIGLRWSKLLINATMSGVSAALGCSFGDILKTPDALKCAQYIARELILVTNALNIELEPLGLDEKFQDLMYFNDESDRNKTDPIYFRLWGPSAEAEGSMLQDIRRGTRSEIDYINGVLSNAGKQAGMPTPVCDKVIEVVKKAEENKTITSMNNLQEFHDIFS